MLFFFTHTHAFNFTTPKNFICQRKNYIFVRLIVFKGKLQNFRAGDSKKTANLVKVGKSSVSLPSPRERVS
ncbi:unnamed protein product [Hermetia illucens]|uniref:Uncharacterized protein n=1 Tax=Hermetia illucens TaxID=343691 RepID=A0A7R8UL63_HERIL|nr:unnamed protein product [Hermetia illucens]